MQEIEDDKQKTEIETVPESGLFNAGSASAGPMLRAARKDKSMSIDDVSEQLNLSHSVVDAIENDSWEHLPEATYVRGYIRSYAGLLGLDPADVLMSFRYNNSEQNISLDSMPRKIEDRKIGFSVPKKIKLLFVIAVITGVVTYLYNNQSLSLLESTIDQVTEHRQESTNEEAKTNLVDSNDNVPNTTVETPSEAESTPSVSVSVSQNTNIAAESKQLLELEFNSTSWVWVDIRDKEGEKLIYKSFPPGDKTSVTATLPIYVFIGDADAVAMHYQGQAVDLQQYKEEGYAKFTLE